MTIAQESSLPSDYLLQGFDHEPVAGKRTHLQIYIYGKPICVLKQTESAEWEVDISADMAGSLTKDNRVFDSAETFALQNTSHKSIGQAIRAYLGMPSTLKFLKERLGVYGISERHINAFGYESKLDRMSEALAKRDFFVERINRRVGRGTSCYVIGRCKESSVDNILDMVEGAAAVNCMLVDSPKATMRSENTWQVDFNVLNLFETHHDSEVYSTEWSGYDPKPSLEESLRDVSDAKDSVTGDWLRTRRLLTHLLEHRIDASEAEVTQHNVLVDSTLHYPVAECRITGIYGDGLELHDIKARRQLERLAYEMLLKDASLTNGRPPVKGEIRAYGGHAEPDMFSLHILQESLRHPEEYVPMLVEDSEELKNDDIYSTDVTDALEFMRLENLMRIMESQRTDSGRYVTQSFMPLWVKMTPEPSTHETYKPVLCVTMRGMFATESSSANSCMLRALKEAGMEPIANGKLNRPVLVIHSTQEIPHGSVIELSARVFAEGNQISSTILKKGKYFDKYRHFAGDAQDSDNALFSIGESAAEPCIAQPDVDMSSLPAVKTSGLGLVRAAFKAMLDGLRDVGSTESAYYSNHCLDRKTNFVFNTVIDVNPDVLNDFKRNPSKLQALEHSVRHGVLRAGLNRFKNLHKPLVCTELSNKSLRVTCSFSIRMEFNDEFHDFDGVDDIPSSFYEVSDETITECFPVPNAVAEIATELKNRGRRGSITYAPAQKEGTAQALNIELARHNKASDYTEVMADIEEALWGYRHRSEGTECKLDLHVDKTSWKASTFIDTGTDSRISGKVTVG